MSCIEFPKQLDAELLKAWSDSASLAESELMATYIGEAAFFERVL